MYGPSRPSASALRRRMLANVPRIITSCWPRRAPYELNSSGPTPWACSHWPAGDVGGDRAGGRDVVGRDRVAQHREDPRVDDVADRRGLERQAVEERRLGDVGRVVRPGVPVARRDRQGAPSVVALEDRGVGRPEQLRVDRRSDDRPDLVGDGPDVGEEDRLARRRRSRAVRWSGRCRPGRPARTRRRAAGRRGSSPAPAGGSGPRSCGCRTGRPRRPGRSPRPRRRPPRRAARSCRCRSCSRSRRARTRAPRAAP